MRTKGTHMKKNYVLVLLSFCIIFNANAFDLNLFANNKESESKFLKNRTLKELRRWQYNLNDSQNLLPRVKSSFSQALKTFKSQDAYCDLGFYEIVKNQAMIDGLIVYGYDFDGYVTYLRQENVIDDLLYMNMISSQDLSNEMAKDAYHSHPRIPPFNRYTDDTKDVDLKKIYSNFSTWPDEKTGCSLGLYKDLSLNLHWKDKKDRDQLLRKLNYMAYDNEVISLETYNKLEVMRQKKAIDWPVHIRNYIGIVTKAKDKLSPTGQPEFDPSTYSTKYADRKAKLTQRARLYRNFDSTQVIMLSDIILKTSKRMDSKNVYLEFQYEEGPDSEIETYVLSPMERYRVSIKMLRKDLGEIMRSDLFINTAVNYEDLVTAAYETGLLKSEELELILKFEEFWNPKDPKWKAYAGFAFSILGTATFYLPPPWNIVGAIALIVTQTQLNKGQDKPDPDDNWNVVI